MRKLLRADFYRLRKNKVLWLCAAISFIFSAFILYKLRSDENQISTLEMAMMEVFPFFPIFYGTFSGLFLGVEYQDGTLRNKLIAGHFRWNVYLSALVTVIAGCFLIVLAWILGSAAGALALGTFKLGGGVGLLMNAVLILMLTAAEASLLTLIAMLIPNRAASAVVSILAMLGLVAIGGIVYNALCEPEFASSAILTANGIEISDPSPNPYYISGTLRKIYQFLVDALPGGQAVLLANQELMHPIFSLCASFEIVLITSIAGIVCFKRKNLK